MDKYRKIALYKEGLGQLEADLERVQTDTGKRVLNEEIIEYLSLLDELLKS